MSVHELMFVLYVIRVECIILFYFIDCNYCKSNSSELLINLFYSYSYSYNLQQIYADLTHLVTRNK